MEQMFILKEVNDAGRQCKQCGDQHTNPDNSPLINCSNNGGLDGIGGKNTFQNQVSKSDVENDCLHAGFPTCDFQRFDRFFNFLTVRAQPCHHKVAQNDDCYHPDVNIIDKNQTDKSGRNQHLVGKWIEKFTKCTFPAKFARQMTVNFVGDRADQKDKKHGDPPPNTRLKKRVNKYRRDQNSENREQIWNVMFHLSIQFIIHLCNGKYSEN